MLAFTNQYLAVLDACVLAAMPVCDTLLRLAEEPAFYIPKWSEDILEEVQRTLLRWGRHTEAQAAYRIQKMVLAFEDAMVAGYEPLIDSMTNHPKDRHVLAAAVKCGAHAIVSDNVRDFPANCLQPYGIELVTADDFLVHQFHFDKDQVINVIEQQAAKIRRTPGDLAAHFRLTMPKFGALITPLCV
jgi:predicted nucleic acid-binding protein